MPPALLHHTTQFYSYISSYNYLVLQLRLKLQLQSVKVGGAPAIQDGGHANPMPIPLPTASPYSLLTLASASHWCLPPVPAPTSCSCSSNVNGGAMCGTRTRDGSELENQRPCLQGLPLIPLPSHSPSTVFQFSYYGSDYHSYYGYYDYYGFGSVSHFQHFQWKFSNRPFQTWPPSDCPPRNTTTSPVPKKRNARISKNCEFVNFNL